MSTILFWGSIAIIVLWVFGRIPLFGDLLVPIFQGFGRLFEGFFRVLGGWLLWIVRGVIFAHFDLLRHLRYSRSQYDPSEIVDDP